ncbi:hypothetical protein ABFX02_07G072900 [Erythranthe guttata]
MTKTNPTNLFEFTVKKSRTHKSKAPSKNLPLSMQNISDQPSKTLKPHDKPSNNIGSGNSRHKFRSSQGCSSSSTMGKKRTRDQSLKNTCKKKLTKEDEEKNWLDQPLSEFRIPGGIPDLDELNAVEKNTCRFLGINNPGCHEVLPPGLSVIPGPVPDNLGDIKFDDINFDTFFDMSDDDVDG